VRSLEDEKMWEKEIDELKIFVDTWGWLTLLDQKESKHFEHVGMGFQRKP